MASRSPGLLFIVLVAVTGCTDKGQAIVDEATAVYEAGDPAGGAHVLERLAVEVPDAPQQPRAVLLATRWLGEAIDATEEPDAKRGLLDAGLQWEPTNATFRSKLCRLELEVEDWEAARACVEAGRGVVPADRLAGYEDKIVAHDRDIAELEERTRLIASESPDDWRSLISKHGASDEAAVARERLLASSLCEDLFRFVEPLKLKGSSSPLSWGERISAETGRNGQVTVLTSIRDEAATFAGMVAELRKEAAEHGLQPGEEELRDALVAAYTSLEPPLATLGRAFRRKRYKMEDRLSAVAAFDAKIQPMSFKLRDLRKDTENACEDLRAKARQ